MRVVLLGLPPSLRRLRQGLPLFVRLLHRYYAAVRPLQCVHARRSALRLRGPVYFRSRRPGGLPVLVHVVSRRARVFDHAAFRPDSRCIVRDGCRLPAKQTVSARGSSVIGAQSPGPPMPLPTLRRTPRDAPRKIKVRIESLLLFCGALSSPTTCRFIPAHSHPCVALSSAAVIRRLAQNRNRTFHVLIKPDKLTC